MCGTGVSSTIDVISSPTVCNERIAVSLPPPNPLTKTPYAAGLAAEQAGKAAMDSGVKKVEVFVKGLGGGRETAIRSLQTVGLEITSIVDETPVPHNGCRPPKRPRN